MSKLLQELADVSDVFNITEVKFGLLNPEFGGQVVRRQDGVRL